MSEITKRAEDLYQIPCGPMNISADGICRKALRDSHDHLLDRLTQEINPAPDSRFVSEDYDRGPDGSLLPKVEDSDARRAWMIKEGKLRAEVSQEVRKYKEQLQGNSKLLQDTTGKIEPF